MKQAVDDLAYPIPAAEMRTEFEIKRSKFLSFVMQADSKVVADDFIRDVREKHPKANHVCWAYIVGSPKSTIRSMSDDGEPNGTAGLPMLKVLEHSGLGDVVVAVVRYFGGTKLGTGGLQRAYSDAVSQVLQDLPIQTKVFRVKIRMSYDYVYEGQVARLLNRYDVDNVITNYEQQVSACVDVAQSQLAEFEAELINMTGGSIQMIKPY